MRPRPGFASTSSGGLALPKSAHQQRHHLLEGDAATGRESTRRISSLRSTAGSARNALAKSTASAPQNTSPSATKLGTPNTPRAAAASVFILNASFISDRRAGSTLSSLQSAPKRAGSSACSPLIQIHSKMRLIASGLLPQASASRRWGSGLNGCAGGERKGTPDPPPHQGHPR